MTDINTLVYEGLAEHLKKHWGKYALALGTAGLAGLGKYQQHKNQKIVKRLKIGAGLAGAGLAAHQIYHYNKAKNALKRIDKIAQKRHNYLAKAKDDEEKLKKEIQDNYNTGKISRSEALKQAEELNSQIDKMNKNTARRANQLNQHIYNAQKHSLYHQLFKNSFINAS